MKTQTKKTTARTSTYRLSHTPAQRFWGIMAFFALFTCGVMVGMGINGDPNRCANTAHAAEVVTQPEEQPEQPKKTCEIIEESLLVRIPNGDVFASSDARIDRAKIYANLSERGCAENAQKYHDMAKQELAIARALRDDVFIADDSTIEVVETYKRLNMQAAAEEIFETAKKLTNPAIDFILEVEKIINEQ